jgi:hypothetical protein
MKNIHRVSEKMQSFFFSFQVDVTCSDICVLKALT